MDHIDRVLDLYEEFTSKEDIEMLVDINKTLSLIIIEMVKNAHKLMDVTDDYPVIFQISEKAHDYLIQLEECTNSETNISAIRVTLTQISKLKH